jgi:hypothetical protein
VLFQLNSAHQPSTTGHLLVTDHPEDKAITITVISSPMKSMSPMSLITYTVKATVNGLKIIV